MARYNQLHHWHPNQFRGSQYHDSTRDISYYHHAIMPEIYLPPEIWQYVVRSLCLHCFPEPATLERRHHLAAAATYTKALASLCRTSTRLNQLATPCLY